MSLPVVTKGSYCSTVVSRALCGGGAEVTDRLPATTARLPLDGVDEVGAGELARREHAASENDARPLAQLLHGAAPAGARRVGARAFQGVEQQQEVVAQRE